MRITTRLKTITIGTSAALAAAGLILPWSFITFLEAKQDQAFASELRVNFLERASLRDQFFLHHEDRLRVQWDQSRERADRLILEAERLVHSEGDRSNLENLRRAVQDTATLFHRITDQAKRPAAPGEDPAVWAELERRLSSQLLLKAAGVRNATMALENACAQRVELTYQRLLILFGLFGGLLAFATLLTSLQILRLIRAQLVPLHAGVKAVAGGNLDFRFKPEGSDEFSEIARAIDVMTEKLQVSTQLLGEEISRRLVLVALQESEARFRAWFDLPIIGICITSPAKEWLEVNNHLCYLLGYGREELAGRTWTELTHPEDLAMDVLRFERVLHGEIEGYSCEKRFLRKDGASLPVELATRCVRKDDGEVDYFVTLILDITDRKRAEEEQQRLTAQLQQVQKMESLGRLAGGVAHDMNNVLGAILGLASAHLELQPAGSPAYRAFETITKAASRGGELVKSLLSFARQSLAEECELDMNSIIQEEVRILEHTTLSKVCLEMDLEAELRTIRGDPSALTHALMNLCVNAVDAMPEHGNLTLRTRNIDHDWIEIRVEDTGSGMPKEVLEKAMDPFFTTKGVGKGTGLGLSMVYSTVKAHRGQIEIESQPGAGTRVSLRFPAIPPAAAVMGTLENLGIAPTRRALQVLLVDDDELIQASTQMILEMLGHTSTAASSGEEALSKLEAGLKPDLVILDMNMPGMGGARALPRLRALCPTLPVLLATGRADQTALDLVEAHPFVTLMAKPFSMKELRQHLESLDRA